MTSCRLIVSRTTGARLRSALGAIRGRDRLESVPDTAERISPGQIPLGDLRDERVVRVAHVGDRALRGLCEQLVRVEGIEPELVPEPHREVPLRDPERVL